MRITAAIPLIDISSFIGDEVYDPRECAVIAARRERGEIIVTVDIPSDAPILMDQS